MNLKEQMELYSKFKEIGQSIWLDSISRDMILNKTLANMIEKYDIVGLTSNPTIFENAILNSNSYDDSIQIAAKRFTKTQDIAYSLMIEDIQRTCDLLKNVYEKTNATDGFVSIEIPPTIDDINSIIECSIKIWEMINRENLMIKIPATKNGIIAGEELLKKGINVNMTLIFSPQIYSKVADAYLSAIKWRIENNISGNIFSVASFFVSRIDTEVTNIFSNIINSITDIEKINEINMLKGKAAVTVSLIVYEIYLKKFYSDDFKKYKELGIKPQKLLWASTSTKEPLMKDSYYLDELCLPYTINTAPQQTIYAFFEHGSINDEKIETRISQAHNIYEKIESFGVNWEKVYEKLLMEGIKKFISSYNNILKAIENKIKNISSQKITMQIYNAPIKDLITKIEKENFIKRLFLKDVTLWKKDIQDIKTIKNSLGWLEIPNKIKEKLIEIESFRDEIIKEGFRDVVLLGMGGSSLASEVIVNVFGQNKKIKFYVLDSTNPDWINRIIKNIKLEKTIFIVSSKSGTTLETISHLKYIFNLLKNKVKKPGKSFVAITDKNTPLEQIATKYKFRKIFINPSDIGGRFSVFSYFGLVPASFTQANLSKLITNAQNAMSELNKDNSPGIVLGAFLGLSYLNGKDKLTLIVPKKLQRFGLWVEQLIAESTGKEGKGILPIIDYEIYEPSSYSNDRCFVVITLKNFPENEEKINQIIKSGHPLLKIYLDDIYDIAKEFYRWEIATALCGHIMKINPFDQPDVQFTKEFTQKILKSEKIKLIPQINTSKINIYTANIKNIKEKYILWDIINNTNDNGYIAFCAYIDENTKNTMLLEKIKRLIIEKTSIPTITVYGPRYLHSIGQLFKGGKNSGTFIILTSKPKKDIKILGEDLSFKKICISQAQGDFLAMMKKGRKCIMIHEKKEGAFLQQIMKELKSLTLDIKTMEENNMPRTALKNTKKQLKNNTNTYVVIDYPKHQETITSSHYTIRIGASPTSKVEVSIDGGPWVNARESVGYWWFDWYNINPGNHEIIARIQTGENTYLTSKRRRCKVIF
ncbi:MAG: bifunctional transaldolase/phosoglucose isomerase [Elusimicrobiales bacterium]|nr:bifunctional transaldolase/phosoglucose isomerase [Elusimicrobiales bacterium]